MTPSRQKLLAIPGGEGGQGGRGGSLGGGAGSVGGVTTVGNIVTLMDTAGDAARAGSTFGATRVVCAGSARTHAVAEAAMRTNEAQARRNDTAASVGGTPLAGQAPRAAGGSRCTILPGSREHCSSLVTKRSSP